MRLGQYKEQLDMLILDISKAFDVVPHCRLVNKLNFYGIRDNTLTWITNWLSGRTQRVVVDGECSSESSVKSGVPQGTVLGPLMFILYINDIGKNTGSSIRLFADDCVLYRVIREAADAEVLQNDLSMMCSWAKDWQMLFNADKCSLLTVTRKRNPLRFTYNIHGKNLKLVEHHPYLGLELDKDLNWNHHAANTVNKAQRLLNLLRRNLSGCSADTKGLAYKALVRPVLEYAACAWDPYQAKHIQQLESVQRRAARFVTKEHSRFTSVTELLKRLEWRSLQERRLIARLAMFHKTVHGQAACIIPECFKPSAGDVCTRGSRAGQYTIPHGRVDVYRFSFFPRTIRLWNMLPAELVQSPDVQVFRTQLQDYFWNGRMWVVAPKDTYHRPRLGSSSCGSGLGPVY